VFRQFHLLCRELGLLGGELVAIDGTKLKAVNSAQRNFSAEQLAKLLTRIDARLAEFLQALDNRRPAGRRRDHGRRDSRRTGAKD